MAQKNSIIRPDYSRYQTSLKSNSGETTVKKPVRKTSGTMLGVSSTLSTFQLLPHCVVFTGKTTTGNDSDFSRPEKIACATTNYYDDESHTNYCGFSGITAQPNCPGNINQIHTNN
ncbi:MAG: hypothetical protein R3C26_11850 [Calditrichia bacterium]